MAIAVPVAGTEISATTFGAPVANALNALEVTAWVRVPLMSGWTHNAQTAVQYRKVGDSVQVRGRADNPAGAGWSAVGTLPAGFRPPTELMIAGCVVITNVWRSSPFQVLPNGQIVISEAAQAAAPTFSFSTLPNV